MYYYLIIALQGYCIYHSIKNRNDYYWIFIIFFVPVIGSVIYLITQVFNKRDLEQVQQNIISTINPTKKILELKKQLEFSETFQNKVNLADAYFEVGDFKNAIDYYENATSSIFSGNTYVISNLIEAYYRTGAYEKVIQNYLLLKEKQTTINPNNQLQYGLSLFELGKMNIAERVFQAINIDYSNYDERLILAKHYLKENQKEKAKEILQNIYKESKHFSRDHRRIYRQTLNSVNSILRTL